MAPYPLNLSHAHIMLETGSGQIEQRGLGNTTAPRMHFSLQEQMNLQILATTLSSISVASAVLAFYWFVQMRRTFRHHLIMLLIQSDMFKALWFLIYPVVVYTHGPQLSTSAFCQVNGFFVAIGTEASDFAILMIAMHSALSIFCPVTTAGEGGLYPYRRTAYVLWVVFPVLVASLAFIHGSHTAYASQGTYCLLPVRPFWYRLALSWIPRYIIFTLIFGIYAAIYLYVRYKLSDFTKSSQDDSDKNKEQNSIRLAQRQKRRSLPATPELAYHGLIPESRANSLSENRAADPSRSTVSFNPEVHDGGNSEISVNTSSLAYIEPQMINHQDYLQEPSNGFACNSSSCNSASSPSSEAGGNPVSSLPNTTDLREGRSIAEHDFQPVRGANSPRPFSTASTLIIKPKSSVKSFFNRSFSPRSASIGSGNPRSLVGIFSALKHPEATTTTMASNPKLFNEDGQNLAVSELARTRDKIRKQLRFLFIYPLVYIAMWVVPFVNHVLEYSDKFVNDPPYALAFATVAFVTLQCAVDCWLFSTREQPWRHMPSNEEGTFWGSFIFWRSQRRRKFPGNRGTSGPGKSRVEQVAEATMAYKRREEEAEVWKRNSIDRRNSRARMESGGLRDDQLETERNWWDSGFDGLAMSPVVEERNPLDTEMDIDDIDPLENGVERMVGIERSSSIITNDGNAGELGIAGS